MKNNGIIDRLNQKTLSIHINDLCNSKCVFCVVDSPASEINSVSFDRIKTFLADNKDDDFKVVNLHGGEPTIHPEFLDILSLIRVYGYNEIHLQTNAMTLSDKEFAEKVVANGVELSIISLHGFTKQQHEIHTGVKESFDKTISAIKNLKELKVKLRINTVVTKHNFNSLPDLLALTAQLDIDHVNISNLHPVGSTLNMSENIIVDLPTLKHGINQMSDSIRNCLVPVTFEGFPYCILPYDFRSKCTELVERKVNMLIWDKVIDDYTNFMNTLRRYSDDCSSCTYKGKCGGVYPEYVDVYGWDGIKPIVEQTKEHSIK